MFESFKKKVTHLKITAVNTLSLTPICVLRRALLQGDERKALEICSKSVFGDTLSPSEPFPDDENMDTPLHFASASAMQILVDRFLLRGGNPNITNSRLETSLHSLFSNHSNDEIRSAIFRSFCHMSQVSLYPVNHSGDSPLHLAARNNLKYCVLEFLSFVSGKPEEERLGLVNLFQMNACDESCSRSISDILELKMIFYSYPCINIPQPNLPIRRIGQDLNKSLTDSDLCLLLSKCLGCSTWLPNYVSSCHSTQIIKSVTMHQNKFSYSEIGIIVSVIDEISTLCEIYQVTPAVSINELIQNNFDFDQTLANLNADDNHVNNSSKVSPVITTCQICGDEDLTEYFVFDNSCRHVFCSDCFKRSFVMQVSSEFHSLLLKCPSHECVDQKPIHCPSMIVNGISLGWTFFETVFKLLISGTDESQDKKLIEIYFMNFYRLATAHKRKAFRFCPYPGCGSICTSQSEPAVYYVCCRSHLICEACNESYHFPLTCAEFKQWQTKISSLFDQSNAGNAENLMNYLWLFSHAKQCPSCKNFIEKTEGCNHMVCRTCKHEFCWVCMKMWSLHGTQTGGYFQCNLFQQTNSDNDNDDTIKLDDVTVAQTDGSHVAEMNIMNKKGQQTDDFLALFSKYSAHDQSSKIEQKFFLTTIYRLFVNLICYMDYILNQADFNHQTLINKMNAVDEEEPINLFSEEVVHDQIVAPTNDDSWKLLDGISELFKAFQDQNSTNPNPSKPEEKLMEFATIDVMYLLDWIGKCDEKISNIKTAFVELLLSRNLLKMAYVYKYYNMNESHSKHNRSRVHLSGSDQDLKIFMEILKEFEFLVECLSDILARKRFRASLYQLEEVYIIVGRKRRELETFLTRRSDRLQNKTKPKTKTDHRYSSNRRQDEDDDLMRALAASLEER